MKLLYKESIEEEELLLEEELSGKLPSKNEIYKGFSDPGFLENLPLEFEEKKVSKLKYALVVIPIIIVVALGSYFVSKQSTKVKEEQRIAGKLLQEQELGKREIERKLDELQQKLNALEEQKTNSAEEKKQKDEQINRLKKLKQEQEQKKVVKAQGKKPTTVSRNDTTSPKPDLQEKEKTTTTEEASPKSTKEIEERVIPNQTDKKPEVTKIVKEPTPLVNLKEVSQKPVKISGKNPKFSQAMNRTYAGRRTTVRGSLLIDENGNVTEVKLSIDIPSDVREVIIQNYKKWKYSPAKKGDQLVKVWIPVKMKITFKYNLN
jgi:outer membrane biosynthesis protein TonB